MGFGANFFFIFVFVPISVVLFVAWIISKRSEFGNMLGFLVLSVIGFSTLISTINWLNSKTVLLHDDYYGTYVIDRDYFSGTQADWQYNHFRFEITEDDSIFFHETNGERIVRTYKGVVRTTDRRTYRSARLIIEMEQPTHHILSTNPTTYRNSWSFYLVFKSRKFHNVYFERGEWEPLEL